MPITQANKDTRTPGTETRKHMGNQHVSTQARQPLNLADLDNRGHEKEYFIFIMFHVNNTLPWRCILRFFRFLRLMTKKISKLQFLWKNAYVAVRSVGCTM